jgi:murein DD-endopeptidase MepM/ murein hydrolase activator NlpD
VNRKVVLALAFLVWIGMSAVPAQAQSGGPASQAAAPQVTVHIVQRGETLFSIARRYGSTVDAITHANGIRDPRQIYVGQRLVIPGNSGHTGVAGTVPYMVQAGDTLTSISRRYLTTWQTLVQVNGLLSPHTIHAGQVIQVPALNASAGEGEVTPPPTGVGLAYIVRSDDTLLRIALRYGISPWTLAAASHVANPALIYPGQELRIPGAGPGLLPEPFAFAEVQPLPVTQGTTMVIAVRTTEPVTLEGRLFGQEVRFAEEGGIYYGLAGVHVFTEPGLYELELRTVDGRGRNTAITTGVIVESGRFGYERIDLPASTTSLLDPALVAAERERLDALRHRFTLERHWTTVLQRPCIGTISSYFGSHRAYSGGPYTSYHSGVDFRAPGGTPVHASAGGTVVLAEPLAMRGKAVVIDHGWGLLTGYWHLSSIEVQVGQQVAQGDLIGKVGNTGLSTGAHLHWEVWVGGTSVDGLQWLEEFYPWPEPEWLAIGG